MKVLLSCASFLPSYGGPARSVSRLALALAEAGCRVGLWAPDGSASTTPLRRDHAALSHLEGGAREALGRFGRPDVWHDNGIWLPHNHAIAALTGAMSVARIVSLRGMLEPAAMRHRGWKKRLAWPAYQKRDLKSAAWLHATAEQEAENLEGYGLNRPVAVIPNGADLPSQDGRGPMTGVRTALFVGRIHPIKGLSMLIDAWAGLRPAGWRLVIAGPDEADTQAGLERQVLAHGLQAVDFVGPVDEADRDELYRSSDLFVLPSLSENFGMAAAEALSFGLPVIATQGTPWRVLEERHCGWWPAPQTLAVQAALAEACGLERAQLQAMGARGRELIAEAYGWDAIAARFTDLYRQALESSAAR